MVRFKAATQSVQGLTPHANREDIALTNCSPPLGKERKGTTGTAELVPARGGLTVQTRAIVLFSYGTTIRDAIVPCAIAPSAIAQLSCSAIEQQTIVPPPDHNST